MHPVHSVSSHDFKGHQASIEYLDSLDRCPVCGDTGTMSRLTYKHEAPARIVDKKFWISFQCPSNRCQSMFIGEFIATRDRRSNVGILYVLNDLFPKKISMKLFEKDIADLSPGFISIYNEAYHAEQLGLLKICGPGYRKALEFLIKDFCIMNAPADELIIKTDELLGETIKNRIEDENIKQMAVRASWIGNDETHYSRRWDNKDLDDLKSLITVTSNFIHNKLLAKRYLSEMPSKPKIKSD